MTVLKYAFNKLQYFISVCLRYWLLHTKLHISVLQVHTICWSYKSFYVNIHGLLHVMFLQLHLTIFPRNSRVVNSGFCHFFLPFSTMVTRWEQGLFKFRLCVAKGAGAQHGAEQQQLSEAAGWREEEDCQCSGGDQESARRGGTTDQ